MAAECSKQALEWYAAFNQSQQELDYHSKTNQNSWFLFIWEIDKNNSDKMTQNLISSCPK